MNSLVLEGDLESVSRVVDWIMALPKFPKTILLYGEIGAGKTTLISQLLKKLGNTEKVTSPTFTLVNEYQCTDRIIYHMDWYRVNSVEELYEIGISEYLYDKPGTAIVEWPEIGVELLPDEGVLTIKIDHLDRKRSYDLNFK